MKLSHPFYRLPIQIDIERLRAEVAGFAESEWYSHPTGYPGNAAIRLISVGGGENDEVGGVMRPTPQLMRCAYLRQVLASFGVVWSRTRLMRLAPGAVVPEHCDVNYHWAKRVRIHIPVETDPSVSFTSGGVAVHMEAGQAWVFDNWRNHGVRNDSAKRRIHLVADTAGNAAFWDFVERAQTDHFERPQPIARVIPYRPEINAQPFCERFNLSAVMHPSELDQLTTELLAEVELDGPSELTQQKIRLDALVTGFAREWRSLWLFFGDSKEGWPHFGRLRDGLSAQIKEFQTLKCRANGTPIVRALEAQVLLYALNPDLSSSLDGDATVSVAPQVPVLGQRFKPEFKRPIFIVAAPRSGSTLLFETLAKASALVTVGGEAHWLLESLPQLWPWADGVGSNRLGSRHLTPAVKAHVLSQLAANLQQADGAYPNENPVRLLEKTPKNALRIPFFNALFPDALFIHLWRDPRENISSIIDAWRSGGWVTYPELPGWDGPWSMLLPPEWRTMRGHPVEEIGAFQWSSTNRIISNDLAALPRDRWMKLSHASFLDQPLESIRRICDFAGVDCDGRLIASLNHPLPLSRHTLTPPDQDKWRRNADLLEPLLPAARQLQLRLGLYDTEFVGDS